MRYVGEMLYASYRWWKVAPAVGFQAPFPFGGHLHRGNRFDAPPNLFLRQLEGAHPSRVKMATHVADLMDPALQWRDSAANECGHQVLTRQSCLLELRYQFMDGVDFQDLVFRVIPPIVLARGRPNLERREVDEIDIGGVLHVEPGPEPFLT